MEPTTHSRVPAIALEIGTSLDTGASVLIGSRIEVTGDLACCLSCSLRARIAMSGIFCCGALSARCGWLAAGDGDSCSSSGMGASTEPARLEAAETVARLAGEAKQAWKRLSQIHGLIS